MAYRPEVGTGARVFVGRQPRDQQYDLGVGVVGRGGTEREFDEQRHTRAEPNEQQVRGDGAAGVSSNGHGGTAS